MTHISVIRTVDYFIDKMTLCQEFLTMNYIQKARIVKHIGTNITGLNQLTQARTC